MIMIHDDDHSDNAKIIDHANYKYIHDDCDDNHDDYVDDDEENVDHDNICLISTWR